MDAEVVSITVAAVSAMAAATSAWFSRRAVERGHAPFVWPSYSIRLSEHASQQHRIGICLHNGGVGVAFDVRFTIATPDSLRLPETLYVPPPIRALSAGEVAPPAGEIEDQLVDDGEYRIALTESLRSDWDIVIRFGDGLGRSWQVRAPSSPEAFLGGPHRLRDRRWQLWRPRCDW